MTDVEAQQVIYNFFSFRTSREWFRFRLLVKMHLLTCQKNKKLLLLKNMVNLTMEATRSVLAGNLHCQTATLSVKC